MSTGEENKATIRRWVQEAWNSGDFSSVPTMYTKDYLYHDPAAPNIQPGPDGLVGMIQMFRAGMSDVHMTIEDMAAEGDIVAWRFNCTGTHTGILFGVPATGTFGGSTGTLFTRFTPDGKWAEDWCNWDTLGMLQRIGLIPVQG